MSKKKHNNTYQSPREKPENKTPCESFEIQYLVVGTVRTKINAEDKDTAYKKALSATTISNIMSRIPNDICLDSFSLIEMKEPDGTIHKYDCEDDESEYFPLAAIDDDPLEN